MARTVVVGYLDRPEGEAALAAALEEGRLREARVVVVRLDRPEPGGAEDDDLAARLCHRLADAGVDGDVRSPGGREPADVLLETAVDHDAVLLVIGLRRRSPVGKLILGANAQRILLDAACPVLAVTA